MKRTLHPTAGIAAAIIACGVGVPGRGAEPATDDPSVANRGPEEVAGMPVEDPDGSTGGNAPAQAVLPNEKPVERIVAEPMGPRAEPPPLPEGDMFGSDHLTSDTAARPFVGCARLWDPVLTSGIPGDSLPFAPSGFCFPQHTLPWTSPGAPTLPAGFRATGSLTGLYNSNINPGGGGSERKSSDDLILTAGGTLSWQSRPHVLSFSAVYRGSYNEYLNNPEMSGYDQGLGLSATYDGGKLSATASINLSSDQGINRYYSSELVRQNNLVSRLVLRYDISPKTSLSADAGYRLATVDSSEYDDTEWFDFGVAAKWKYSPITTLGAGVRYTCNSGDSTRSSLGPELMVDYRLSSKVAINSRLGLEFPSIDGQGSESPSMNGSLALTYMPSEFWAMNLMYYGGTQASASGGFTLVNAVRLGCTRHIGAASVNLGLSYEIDDRDTHGSSISTNTQDTKGLGLDASVGMPVFSGDTYGTIFARYNRENGENGGDWDGFQIGLSLQHTF